jgi:hypothetical protein
MSGFQGQRGIIVPSHELVIIRLGATNGTGTGSFQLVLDIIAAILVPAKTGRANVKSRTPKISALQEVCGGRSRLEICLNRG